MLRSFSLCVASAPKRLRSFSSTPESVQIRDNVLHVPLHSVPNLNPAVLSALSLANASRSELRAAHIAETIKQYRRSPSDTGSSEVQIAVMTERIRGMTKHLKVHPKDKDTERSIVKLVHKRRGMMQYLLRQSPERYLGLAQSLGLRETTVFSKDLGVRGAKNKPTPQLRQSTS